MRKLDTLVLGAGIAGASTAQALLARGQNVALLDRREPGRETSYGNAGIVEVDGLEPIVFPRDPLALLRYASNRSLQTHYHWRILPRLLPWLLALWRASDEDGEERFFRAVHPLMSRALAAHRELARQTGALDLYRDRGWIRMYRSAQSYHAAEPVLARADSIGMPYELIEGEALRDYEPLLDARPYRSLYWPQSHTVASPGEVTAAIARHFAASGGLLARGDAAGLRQVAGEWRLDSDAGPLSAARVVVCLGPWSMDLLRRFGYRYPLQSIRGYHSHLRPTVDEPLQRPLVDVDNGMLLSPMRDGVRLTTAFEFAHHGAPMTPVQLQRLLPVARRMLPLGEEVGERWVGSRPCLPDSLPLVGAAPRHAGLWLHFGHCYLGFTLGPLLGEQLARQICDEPTGVDLAPLGAARFG